MFRLVKLFEKKNTQKNSTPNISVSNVTTETVPVTAISDNDVNIDKILAALARMNNSEKNLVAPASIYNIEKRWVVSVDDSALDKKPVVENPRVQNLTQDKNDKIADDFTPELETYLTEFNEKKRPYLCDFIDDVKLKAENDLVPLNNDEKKILEQYYDSYKFKIQRPVYIETQLHDIRIFEMEKDLIKKNARPATELYDKIAAIKVKPAPNYSPALIMHVKLLASTKAFLANKIEMKKQLLGKLNQKEKDLFNQFKDDYSKEYIKIPVTYNMPVLISSSNAITEYKEVILDFDSFRNNYEDIKKSVPDVEKSLQPANQTFNELDEVVNKITSNRVEEKRKFSELGFKNEDPAYIYEITQGNTDAFPSFFKSLPMQEQKWLLSNIDNLDASILLNLMGSQFLRNMIADSTLKLSDLVSADGNYKNMKINISIVSSETFTSKQQLTAFIQLGFSINALILLEPQALSNLFSEFEVIKQLVNTFKDKRTQLIEIILKNGIPAARNYLVQLQSVNSKNKSLNDLMQDSLDNLRKSNPTNHGFLLSNLARLETLMIEKTAQDKIQLMNVIIADLIKVDKDGIMMTPSEMITPMKWLLACSHSINSLIFKQLTDIVCTFEKYPKNAICIYKACMGFDTVIQKDAYFILQQSINEATLISLDSVILYNLLKHAVLINNYLQSLPNDEKMKYIKKLKDIDSHDFSRNLAILKSKQKEKPNTDITRKEQEAAQSSNQKFWNDSSLSGNMKLSSAVSHTSFGNYNNPDDDDNNNNKKQNWRW